MSHGLPGILGSMLKVGTIGFGGGAALIPVMEKELVDRGALDDKTFGTHTLIANITPGALPVKLGALAGAHTHGWLGSVLSALAVALPGTFATVGLLASFNAIGPEAIRFVEFAAVGIAAFIIVLLALFIAKVLRAGGRRFRVFVLVVLAAFLATGANQLVRLVGRLFGQDWQSAIPQLDALQLILATLAIIGIWTIVHRGKAATPTVGPAPSQSSRAAWWAAGAFTVIVVAIVLASFAMGGAGFLSLVGLSTVTSFGGGEAYVGVADGFFVASGIVPGSEFYGQAVPVANALPGPILVKIASALGYSYGLQAGGWQLGLVFAAAAFLLSVSACSAVAMLLMGGYGKVSNSAFVRRLGAYVLPVICGLLVTTCLSMILANMDIASHAGISEPAVGWATLIGALGLWALHRRFHLHDVVLLLIGGGVSLIGL
ncbi:MAG: chromate transporter, partial [Propionibacteriaceae bacterium]|nr:chromate transporter [Propionibacteriaceae bacterium]